MILFEESLMVRLPLHEPQVHAPDQQSPSTMMVVVVSIERMPFTAACAAACHEYAPISWGSLERSYPKTAGFPLNVLAIFVQKSANVDTGTAEEPMILPCHVTSENVPSP